MKLEIWPGGPSALTQQKLSQPIRVAVFTSHRQGEDNLVDTGEPRECIHSEIKL